MYSTKTGLLFFLLVVFGLLIIRFLLQTLGFSYKEGLSVPSLSSVKDKATQAASTVGNAVTGAVAEAAPAVQQAATQAQQAASATKTAVTGAVAQAAPAVHQAAAQAQQAASAAKTAVTGAVPQVSSVPFMPLQPPSDSITTSNVMPYETPTSTSNCDTLQTFERIANLAATTFKEIYDKGNHTVVQTGPTTHPVTVGAKPGMANKSGVTVQVTN